jgi:fused signal recognition particle receptor
MFDFFKKKGGSSQTPADLKAEPKSATSPVIDDTPKSKLGLFARLKLGLKRTRHVFKDGLADLFLGKKAIDEELLSELEDLLLSADVGVLATKRIMGRLTERLKRNELKDPEALEKALKQTLTDILMPCQVPLNLPKMEKPYVILMIGVNGSGKTTSIGKLAKQLQNQGKTLLLAAGDTFRAAAIEQLQVWGERNQVPVIAQQIGGDSASVIYDAFQAAMSRKVDVLLADTAGRLHTQSGLMEELKKIGRVLTKLDPTAPHEVLLVLDASIGQNALNQAQKFHEAMRVTGIVLTKLDGTAKGGIIFNIAETLKLPIRFIGVGEKIDDLRPFQASEFVDALFMSNEIANNEKSD